MRRSVHHFLFKPLRIWVILSRNPVVSVAPTSDIMAHVHQALFVRRWRDEGK